MPRYDASLKARRKLKDAKLTLDAFVSQVYLLNIKIRKRSWHIDERIARQYLSPVFGHRILSEIDRFEVEDWMNRLLESGLAPSSCNRFLAVFKTICSFAETRGLLEPGKSPCLGVSSFKVHAQRERYLLQDEAQRLMARLERNDRPEALALRLLLLTGARKNEILKARWENVNLEQRLLTVPLSKSGKPRHIVLSNTAIAVIKTIPQKAGIPWLFPGHAKDKPLSDLYFFWNKLRAELSLKDVRIHDLRHTFASFLVNAGHSLYEVQKMLGHADPRTTMRYAHLGQDSLTAAAEMVGSIFSSPTANPKCPKKHLRKDNSALRRPSKAGRRAQGESGRSVLTETLDSNEGRRLLQDVERHLWALSAWLDVFGAFIVRYTDDKFREKLIRKVPFVKFFIGVNAFIHSVAARLS